MKLVNVTDEKFEIQEDFDFDEYMRHSFKVMHEELYRVRVRISPEWARWVGEKIWHESQKTRHLKSGGLDMTFEVAGLDEIKRWVLSLGKEAEVLEPGRLKEEIQNDLARTLSLYGERIMYKIVHDV
jgi:predicted DNA-binding transcriptional regulator YafY